MSAPKCIVAAIDMMRAERVPVAARLDAIDLAIDNISRIWGLNGAPKAVLEPSAPAKRRSQRLEKPAPAESDSTEAASRRALLVSVIGKSEVGLTIGELKRATPKMAGQERSNALHKLKVDGVIRRAGNAWVKVA